DDVTYEAASQNRAVMAAAPGEQSGEMATVPTEAREQTRSTAPPHALAQRTAAGAITARAVALALALVPLNAWWLIETEYVRYADNATTAALFFNAVALILLLLAGNALLARWRPAWRFTPAELVVVYL